MNIPRYTTTRGRQLALLACVILCIQGSKQTLPVSRIYLGSDKVKEFSKLINLLTHEKLFYRTRKMCRQIWSYLQISAQRPANVPSASPGLF